MAKKKRSASLATWLIIVLCIASGVFIASCEMFQYEKVSVLPVAIPGAEYVGMDTCATCHEQEYKYFKLSEHSSVTIQSDGDEDDDQIPVEGCETCHGPGSLHVESRGDKSKILRGNPQTCFTCHLDIKGKFMLQHHHPVPEGRMTCSDCHTMHGKDVRATGGAALAGAGLVGKNETCFECHKEMRGPFVFEHDAMREGCQNCHNPHGSIYDKLLVAGQTITCMRCHWESSFNTGTPSLGGKSHRYAIGQGEECVDHHRAPHGSNIWRTLNR